MHRRTARHIVKSIALILVALILAVLVGATTQDLEALDTPILPLWEPDWSPFLMPWDANGWAEIPRGIGVVDLYGDGVPEVVVDASRLYVYDFEGMERKAYGRAIDLRLNTESEDLSYRFLCYGDLNGDGTDDLVAVGSNQVWSLLFDSGRGRFDIVGGAPVAGPRHPFKGWLIDHTGDGILDLVISDNVLNLAYLHIGLGDGQFGEMQPFEGTRGRPFAVAGDASGLWLLTSNSLWYIAQGQLNATNLLGTGGRTLVLLTGTEGGNRSCIAIGTYDGLEIFSQDSGELQPIESYPQVGEILWTLPGDFNGDGIQDLACGSLGTTGYWLLYGTGGAPRFSPYWHGTGTTDASLATQPSMGVVVDVNLDGRDEVMMISSPSTFIAHTPTPMGINRQSLPGIALLGKADVDADVHVDLLADGVDGEVVALINNGEGLFSPTPLVEKPSGLSFWQPYRALIGNIDTTISRELVVWGVSERFGQASSALAAWREDEEGSWHELWTYWLPEGALPFVEVVDLDGDGIRDVIAAAGQSLLLLSTESSVLDPQVREIVLPGSIGWLVPITVNGDELVIAGCRLADSFGIVQVSNNSVDLLDLPLSMTPLDGKVVNCALSGNAELVLIGLDILTTDDGSAAFGSIASVQFEADGARIAWETAVPGWPESALPLPLLGVDIVSRGNVESPELAVLVMSNGVTRPRLARIEISPNAITTWTDNAGGICLFGADVNGDGQDDVVWKLDAFTSTLGILPGDEK